MKDLILEQKTGFQSIMPFTILDRNGKLFYDDTFTKHIARGEKLRFNLPMGIYKYDGNFIKLDKPIETLKVPMPLFERIYPKQRYKIEFGENPSKCTIYYDKSLILFDNSFKDKPLYVKYLIYYHELGHHFYKTESKADFYAAKKLLELGFNPSQIGRACLDSLGEKSYERKIKMVNMLTKNKG